MRIKFLILTMVFFLLAGCGAESVENSLRAPELPAEFIEFNDQISKIKNDGYELVSPNSGSNRQSIQLTDLNCDGVDEGIAFFREMGTGNKVYVYVFQKDGERYKVQARIEGAGDTIDNVTYADMLGNGNNEIIIGWGISDSDAKSVCVYTMGESEIVKLCEVASLYHLVYDLNYDMISDLCVVYEDPADGIQKLAMYTVNEGSILFNASVPLSLSTDTILRIRADYVGDMQPAIFVEKRYLSSGIITDVIVWNETFLKNITYSDLSGESEMTARNYELFAEDIDGDWSLEIPIPQTLAIPNNPMEGEALVGISWYGFSGNTYQSEAFTFRHSAEKWNIMLPLDWVGKCAAVYHKSAGLNKTTFYSVQEGSIPTELFSIVAITGENREKNLEKLGYKKVLEQNDTIYAVEIKKNRYLGYDITAEMIAERFTYKETEWSSGDVVF